MSFWDSEYIYNPSNEDSLKKSSDAKVKSTIEVNNLFKSKLEEQRTLLIDPNEIFSTGLQYKRKLSISEHTLRRMGRFTPFIASIITTRVSQISEHSEPQASRFSKGFIVRKKQRGFSNIGKSEKPTKEEESKINYITDFISNCGDPNVKFNGDNFNSFLKKIAEDSLTLDKACFEVVENKLKEPSYFFAVDAATIFYSKEYNKDALENTKSSQITQNIVTSNYSKKRGGVLPHFVQVIDERMGCDYLPWEMCMGIRNPVTDIQNHGYGISELEKLINVVTYILYTDSYNGKFFSQGSMPKGLLYFPEGTSRSQMLNFRQQWTSSLSGVDNAWKMPTLSGDVKYIDLHKSNVDMQFAHYQESLFNIACAMFKITPEEVGYELGGSTGKNNKLGNDAGSRDRLNFSIRKGLIPIMRSIQTWLNRYVVSRIDPDYEMVFVGTDVESEKEAMEMAIEKSKHFVGLKEIREEWGYDRDLKEDDIILNPQFIQNKSHEEMMTQSEMEDDENSDNENSSGEIVVENKEGEIEDKEKMEKGKALEKEIEDMIHYYKKKIRDSKQ